jgi:hypothetical protein
MKKTDLAWIAGFIDGEGTITIHIKPNRNGHPPCYVPLLAVTNTNLATLKHIQNLLPAPMYDHRPAGKKHKRSWRIQYVGRYARNAIRQILPYLVLKRAVANLVLNFPQRWNGRGQRGPDWRVARKQAKILVQIRKLNKRGR